MKNKAIGTIIISIVAIIGGMVLNFQEFLMGGPATTKNVIVTFSYITIWSLILAISIRDKYHRIIKYCFVFWIINLITAILAAYVGATNATNVLADWVMPFGILLLGQWYGINFFVESFLTTSIIMAVISLIMIIIATVPLKRIN